MSELSSITAPGADAPVGYMQRTREYYAAQGFAKDYVWAHFEDVPFTPLRKPLAESKVAVVTTSALHDRQPGEPRAVVSAPVTPPPERLFANDLSWDKQATHLDDVGSFLPLAPLQQLADSGRIGGLTERFYCVPTEYSQRRTLDQDAPQILELAHADGADVALLVPL